MSNMALTAKKQKALSVSRFLIKFKRQKYLFLLMLPGIAYFLIFKYGPIYGLLLAFKDYDLNVGIFKSPWVGLKYFKQMVEMDYFWHVVLNTLKISLLKIATGFPTPIIFALLLNEIISNKYKRVVQTISYLPHFLSWVVISGLIFQLLSPSYGLYGYIVKIFGMKTEVILGNTTTFMGVVIISHVWKEVGYSSIIYLASIAGIGEEMYEAAMLDGAGRFKRCIHITLPCMAPTIGMLFILGLGGILDGGFDQIFNLYNPLVLTDVDIIDTFVYRIGLTDLQYSFSTAVGISKSIIALVIVVLSNRLLGKLSNYTIW